MNVSRMVNMFAGLFVLFALTMAHMYGQVDLTQLSWLWVAAFVGINLFQYSFTGFCPLAIILKKFGVKD